MKTIIKKLQSKSTDPNHSQKKIKHFKNLAKLSSSLTIWTTDKKLFSILRN